MVISDSINIELADFLSRGINVCWMALLFLDNASGFAVSLAE
jgi:hypothetical protein